MEFCSAFVYANQSLFITLSVQNSAKNCVVDGIELTLRDPDFKRVLQQPNCVDQFVRRNKKSSLPFPLKSPDTAEVTFGLHLPYLGKIFFIFSPAFLNLTFLFVFFDRASSSKITIHAGFFSFWKKD